MANVTIKDIDDNALRHVAAQAEALGMSTQEFLRRLIVREAARPRLPDELIDMAAELRAQRTPMSMDEFDRARRAAMRST
ncbi:MAG: hypothetical protein ACE367_19330 [Acidimicrobiales bacterium]